MKRILTIISTLLFSLSVIFAQEADMKVGELVNNMQISQPFSSDNYQ